MWFLYTPPVDELTSKDAAIETGVSLDNYLTNLKLALGGKGSMQYDDVDEEVNDVLFTWEV